MIRNNPFLSFAAASTPSDTFIGSFEDNTDATTYTFTSHSIGTAHANRVVAIGIIVPDSGTNNQFSSATIGGSAATVAADSSSGGTVGNMRIAVIIYRALSTGTTTTTVVNMANGADGCGIAVWVLYPSSATPTDGVDTSSASAATVTASNVSITTGGTMIAIAGNNNGNAMTWSWTGADTTSEEFDETVADSGNRWSAITVSCSETTTTDDLTASWSGATNCSIAAAAWGPH